MRSDASPPARPGFADTIGLVFRCVGRNAATAAGFAAVWAVPSAVVTTIWFALILHVGPAVVEDTSRALQAALVGLAATVGALLVLGFLLYPVVYAGLAWIGATTAFEGKASVGAVVARLLERGPHAAGAYLLTMLLAAAAPVVLIATALVAGFVVHWAIGVLIGLLALVSIIVPGVVVWVRFLLGPPAAMVEGLGPLAAMRRSADLVRGGFWWVLGLAAITSLTGGLVGSIVSQPMSFMETPNLPLFGVVQVVSQTASVAVAGVAVGVIYAVRALPAPEPPAFPVEPVWTPPPA